MTVETQQAPADSGALSLDQFVSILDAEDAAPETVETAEAEDVEQPEGEIEDPVDDVQDEIADEIEDEEEEVEDEPDVPKSYERVAQPPQSWSKEDQAIWDQLPPAAQIAVSRREADRDKAVAMSRQEVAEQNKVLQAFSARLDEIEPLATSAFERRWGNVDWNAIAEADNENGTQNYNLYKARYEKERDDVERIQREQQAASHVARQRFLQAEAAKLAEIAPQLTDPEKGEERRTKVTHYLLNLGIPAESLRDISAVELSTAHKAMLWDEAQSAAKKAAQQPRKNPVSQAKAAPVGGGQGVTSLERSVRTASERLDKSGKLDDLVALFDAQDAAKSRKARRT